MKDLDVNVDSLVFVCDEARGRRWYYDANGQRYLRLDMEKKTYSAAIPFEQLPTLDQYKHSMKASLVRRGVAAAVTPDKLDELSAPKSQVTIKLMQHKEGLNG